MHKITLLTIDRTYEQLMQPFNDSSAFKQFVERQSSNDAPRPVFAGRLR